MTALVPEDTDASAVKSVLEYVDFLRVDAGRQLDASRRSKMGQFFTPLPVASLMASMLTERPRVLNILDAGAGVGSLTAACIDQLCQWKQKPKEVAVTAYEVEPLLINYLQRSLDECAKLCGRADIKFESKIVQKDFVAASVAMLRDRALLGMPRRFNVAIMNPPYRKISSQSDTRLQLRTVGIETSSLYTAFLWLVIMLLEPDGELVAIVPRSFCNGPYFRPFRLAFLETMNTQRIHIYESRDKAFEEEGVLQENIIIHAVKSTDRSSKVLVSSSTAPDDASVTVREVDYSQLVHPGDEDAFIRIVPDELGDQVKQQMDAFTSPLEELGLRVSTGRVVDFRARVLLRTHPSKRTVPLIYPSHFLQGYISWPGRKNRKPESIAVVPKANELLVPAGFYVLVRRFSAKEEKRRVVAAVYSPKRVPATRVGFENHLNYYHREGRGLAPALAKGLAAFLNTTLVDQYFRQFSGHTQVNANDLMRLKYPHKTRLIQLGNKIGDSFPDQDELDRLAANELTPFLETVSG